MTHEESIAALRLLVCVAKADGVLHDSERSVLDASFHGIDLPQGVTLQWLLDEPVALDAVLAQLQSEDAREHAYASAYSLACSDGDCSEAEREMLLRIRDALGIDETQDAHLARLFLPRHQQLGPSQTPTLDAMARADEVRSATRKCAIVSALLGAFPFPGLAIATDLMVVGLQVGLARDIARLWGSELDYAEAKGILAGFGVGTGARIAVSNLLKVLPGWGIAFGAASSYASSYAVGRVMDGYFEEGRGLSAEELTRRFKAAHAEGKHAYKSDADEIDRHKAERADEVHALERKLKDGAITPAEFEREMAAIVG
jgi:uncharacterized protein (DUF697 family)